MTLVLRLVAEVVAKLPCPAGPDKDSILGPGIILSVWPVSGPCLLYYVVISVSFLRTPHSFYRTCG